VPLKTTESFDSFLKESRKIHFKASHHCQAYRLGPEPLVEFQSDDGEPRGSAGQPILNALKSAELIQVGAIVVRYFGGTKLGVRGLIDAYGESCAATISQSSKVEMQDQIQFSLEFAYEQQSQITTLLHGVDVQQQEAIYGEKIRMQYSVATEIYPEVAKKLSDQLHLGIQYKKLGRCYLAI
jgi:uncharacterized YigZ family protein